VFACFWISHTRTVVRECCKGDDESLWERKKPKPMDSEICVGNYVRDIYHNAKFYPHRFRGFGFAHPWFRAPWHEVTRLFFGSSERLQPRRAHRFWRKIRQTTDQYLRFLPQFFPKTVIFGPISTWQFFSPENVVNIGRLEIKRHLIVFGVQ